MILRYLNRQQYVKACMYVSSAAIKPRLYLLPLQWHVARELDLIRRVFSVTSLSVPIHRQLYRPSRASDSVEWSVLSINLILLLFWGSVFV